MPNPCSLPVADRVCHIPGAIAGSVVGNAFDAVVKSLAEGFGKAAELTMTFWVHVPTPQLSDTSGPVGNLRGATAWLTAVVAVASLLTAAIRLAIVAKPEPAMDAARGLVTLIVASAVGVPAIAAATVAGDAFSTWILDKAGSGALGARLGVLAAAVPTLGSGLVFIIAILGILAAFAQIALMIIRVGALVMLTGILPLVAAGSGTRTGRATFQKVLSWLLAFVLYYKPAAAIVYASAFWLIGEGKGGVQILSGLALMMLSILALPALLRLLTPAVASATSGGGGGAAVAGGVVIATGARAITHGGSGAAPPSSAPTGATATTGKTASGAASGAAGAAGGGAAAAPVVGLVAQGASAAKQAANGAAPGGSTSNGDPNSPS